MYSMRQLLVFCAVIVVVGLAIAGCSAVQVALPQFVPPGRLEGHVEIGPLHPVEQAGRATPTVPPEVYAARELIVYFEDGTRKVTSIKLDAKGNYFVDLAPGKYVVGLKPSGIDRARGLPAPVTIESGKTTRLDIEIDTGIR